MFGMLSLETPAAAACTSGGDGERRVTIWHTVELRKISGNAAPKERNLMSYLASHPHCEKYCGQDKDVSGKKTVVGKGVGNTGKRGSDYGGMARFRPHGSGNTDFDTTHTDDLGFDDDGGDVFFCSASPHLSPLLPYDPILNSAAPPVATKKLSANSQTRPLEPHATTELQASSEHHQQQQHQTLDGTAGRLVDMDGLLHHMLEQHHHHTAMSPPLHPTEFSPSSLDSVLSELVDVVCWNNSSTKNNTESTNGRNSTDDSSNTTTSPVSQSFAVNTSPVWLPDTTSSLNSAVPTPGLALHRSSNTNNHNNNNSDWAASAFSCPPHFWHHYDRFNEQRKFNPNQSRQPQDVDDFGTEVFAMDLS